MAQSDAGALPLELEFGPPDHWHLLGEGGANLVFGYRGTLPHLAGRVLRVRKARPPVPPGPASELELAVWGPVLGEGGSAGCWEERYVDWLLAPLLGRQHIPAQQRIAAPPAFLRAICAREGAEPDTRTGPWLMPDVTLLGGQRQPASSSSSSGGSGCSTHVSAGPVVCIELKPKSGFVTRCDTVHPADRTLKHSTSRYCLHQLLKLEQGTVEACSAYDPCDLFSGEPQRVQRALGALLQHPQNNLQLFRNGQPVRLPGGHQHHHHHQQQQQQQQQQQGEQQQQAGCWVETAAEGLLPAAEGQQQQQALIALVQRVLQQEGALQGLLAAQQQCRYDIEGVYRLYCQLTGMQPDLPAREAANTCSGSSGLGPSFGSCNNSGGSDGRHEQQEQRMHAAALGELLALPLEEAYAVLRAYVISATAKDCAVMLALQRLPAAGQGAPRQQQMQQLQQVCPSSTSSAAAAGAAHCLDAAAADAVAGVAAAPAEAAGVVQEPGTGCWYRYRLVFVDLDLKPLSKIPTHWQLDRSILAAAAAAEAKRREHSGRCSSR